MFLESFEDKKKGHNCTAAAMHNRPGGGCVVGGAVKLSVVESEGLEPIWESWEVGDWVVGLGMEGTGAVVDHCSGMR